jgi:hypothetical protein
MIKRYLPAVCILFLIFGSLVGAIHHTFAFGGVGINQSASLNQLWHGFYLVIDLLCLFAIFSRRELGFYWLLTVFVWQIPVELIGALEAGTMLQAKGAGTLVMVTQVIEPFLDMLELACLVGAKSLFFRK